jgi:hypothetical protein
MATDGACPRPLDRGEATALIGLTAVLEAHLLAGDLDRHVVDDLISWLRSAGVLDPTDGPPQLHLLLADLTQRLRYALGEYDEPPAPATGQVDHHLGFADEAAARDFAAALDVGSDPVGVDGLAYDGAVRWQVAVRTSELPLSAAFDAHVRRLRDLAAEHGGTYGGWGSVPG